MGESMFANGLRCFVAIPVMPDIAHKIAEFGVKSGLGRPVPQENLHLTLAFLGRPPKDTLTDLHFELEAIRQSSFSVRFSGLNQFGSSLHLTIAPNSDLSVLHDRVVRCARRCGMDLPHRRFRPHVTVLRGVNAIPARSVYLRVEQVNTMDITHFCLMSSTLHPDGARYECLSVYPLSPGS